MLQISKGQQQRAIQAVTYALKAVAGASDLMQQAFGELGIEEFKKYLLEQPQSIELNQHELYKALKEKSCPHQLAIKAVKIIENDNQNICRSSYDQAIIDFTLKFLQPTSKNTPHLARCVDQELEVNQYPLEIAKLESKLFQACCEIEKIQFDLKNIETSIDGEVAFDASLRNEQQRKTINNQRLEQDSCYWELCDKLEQARAKHQAISIELSLRRNQFSLMKLELQKQIATLELQIISISFS